MGVIEVIKMQARRDARNEERAKILEEKKEIARNFKNKGIDLKIIAEATGFTLKQVQSF